MAVIPGARPLAAQAPNEWILNRSFDAYDTHWDELELNGASMTLALVEREGFEGRTSRIDRNYSTGVAWHLQLRQAVPLLGGEEYTLRFRGAGRPAAPIEVWIQDRENFEVFHRGAFALAPKAQDFSTTFSLGRDGSAFVAFMLGEAEGGTVFLDGVSVTGPPFVPRADYGRRLEPDGSVVHIAGQDPKGFQEYVEAVGPERVPAAFMAYTSLFADAQESVAEWKALAQQYEEEHGIRLGLQLGLSLEGYADRLARGELSEELSRFAEALGRFGGPVWVRIGYEANGPWNGYAPGDYVAAFRRIAEALRAESGEIATVWNIVSAQTSLDVSLAWYPGDEYVDWWAINFFSIGDFVHPATQPFLDEAHRRGFPVMIGESTPRYVGVLEGDADWSRWFELNFRLIRATPGIKAFSYINWEWTEWSNRLGFEWHDWGDARLQMSEAISERYRREMERPLYLHGMAREEARRRLGAD